MLTMPKQLPCPRDPPECHISLQILYCSLQIKHVQMLRLTKGVTLNKFCDWVSETNVIRGYHSLLRNDISTMHVLSLF